MTKIPKTKNNPHGLSVKQDLLIRDVVAKVKMGKSPKILESIEKIYDVKNRKSALSVKDRNMKNPNFREALIESLIEKQILGADSKTESRLLEGLDAENRDGTIDYEARLKYIQEINKIAGVYAPERKQTLNLNMEMTDEELDKHIKELSEQLQG